MDLKDKVAVVTGASRGLGRALAEALVEKGATVYGLARSEDDLKEVRDALGGRFEPIACDVRDRESVREAFARVRADAPSLDVLVNNAGLGRLGGVAEMGQEDWDVQVETNLGGVFACAQEAIPTMQEQNRRTGFGGHIVNVASVAGLVGNPQLAAYNATKFGVRGFSEALMKEVREDGIKVTCVYPGSIATHFGEVSGSGGSTNPMRAEDVAATVVHVLEGPDNYLISEVMMRPLRPKG